VNLFSFKKKKKRVLLFVFVVFNDLGCVCHEQDSIKLEKFIT
jgi:hypothetical protein